MKNLEQQFSEDLMITQSSKSVRDPLPIDLLIDILSRVPAKSVGRFRCVSKFWESILGCPYYTELFLTRSLARRPRLLFVVEVDDELFVYSTPQPQNPEENSSLVATPYKAFPESFPTKICTPLYGLVFLRNAGSKAPVICNPLTGESITLPKVTGIGQSHFGFDPINKQFKVLRTTWSRCETPDTHQVLTLETGKPLWRPIQDPLLLPHYSTGYNEICISGVVYFRAYFATSSKIVCFDFSSERFGLINMDKDMLHERHLTLFNYKGRLGAHHFVQGTSSYEWKDESVLWVLEDAGKHKWSKRICVLPIFEEEIWSKHNFVGMTGTGELVFSPRYRFNPFPFHVLYYNIERKTFTRFNNQGFEHHCNSRYYRFAKIIVHTSVDYVENMKFM